MADFVFFCTGDRRVKETPLSLHPPLKQNGSGCNPVTPLLEWRQSEEELSLLTSHTLV